MSYYVLLVDDKGLYVTKKVMLKEHHLPAALTA